MIYCRWFVHREEPVHRQRPLNTSPAAQGEQAVLQGNKENEDEVCQDEAKLDSPCRYVWIILSFRSFKSRDLCVLNLHSCRKFVSSIFSECKSKSWLELCFLGLTILDLSESSGVMCRS